MKLRSALLLVAAATACALSLISPQEAAASVDVVNQWPAKPTIASNGSAASASGTFTVGTGVNRLMLVAVTAECTAAPTGVTVTYGGQALTSVVSNTAQANKIWLYRLNEAGIVAAGANKTLSVSLTGAGTVTSIYASAAVYNGVDQTTPITGSNAASKAAAGTTLALSIPLTANAGLTGNTGLTVYVANWDGSTTSTPATGYTEVRDYQGANSSLAYCFKVTTGTTTEAPTSTGAAAVVAAAAGVSLNPALKLATVTTCGDCHGYPPQDGPYVTARNTPPSHFPGAHSKHSGTDEGQYALVCTVCHKDNGTAPTGLKHADGFKNITGSGVPRNTYGGATNIPMTDTSFTETCTKSTCHSSGRTTRQYAASPVWNGTTTCLSCHGGRAAGGAASRSANNFSMSTSHSQHLKYLSTEINCQMCHGKTAASHTALKDYSGALRHANGSKNVLFNNIAYGSYTSYKSPASGSIGTTKTCNNTSCHGGQSRSGWAESTAVNSNHTCAHCHGIANTPTSNTDRRAYAPGFRKKGTSTDQNYSSANRRVGAHFVHLSSAYMKNIKCNECHKVPSTPFSSDTNHTLNTLRFNSGTLDFSQSSSARIAIGVASGSTPAQLAAFSGYTNGTATKAATCSSVYCHGNRLKTSEVGGTYRKPYWNYSAMINYTQAAATVCARCHGYPPTAAGHSASTNCNSCHTNISAADNKTILNKSLHINGRVEGGHAFPYAGASHASAAGTTPWSGCTGCHTNGSNQTYPVAVGTAPDCTGCHKLGLKAPSGTSSCWDCHGSSATNGMPNGAAFPNWSGSHDKHVNGQSMACTVCHDGKGGGLGDATHGSSNRVAHNNTFVNVTSATGQQFHFTWTGKGTCSNVACHGTAEWGVTKLNCVSCHSAAVAIKTGPLTGGTRRAVANELKTSGTRNHKSTAAGTDATKWDCIVCHMEGNMSTGSSVAGVHGNGVLDLRDPDTGNQIKKVQWSGTGAAGKYSDTLTNLTTARFSRNLGVVLEQDAKWLQVASIQMNLCLKCHDYSGAISSNAWTKNAGGTVIGTNLQPFGNAAASTTTRYIVKASVYTPAGNTSGAVMNVFSQLSSGNAAYHPVTGKGNNGYVGGTNMKAPWNTATSPAKVYRTNTVYGWLVSCFDCHAAQGASGAQNGTVVAHGNGTTATTPAMRARSEFFQGSVATPNLCTICHADAYATTSNNHASGASGFNGGSSMSTTTMGTCKNCHGTYTDTLGARAVGAHGADVTESGAATWPTTNSRPYSFIRGTNWTYWGPGSCSNACTTRTYTPGGVY